MSSREVYYEQQCNAKKVLAELQAEDPSIFIPRSDTEIIKKIHAKRPELSGYCIALIMKEFVSSRKGTAAGLREIGYAAKFHLADPILTKMFPRIMISEKPCDQYASDADIVWLILLWGDY